MSISALRGDDVVSRPDGSGLAIDAVTIAYGRVRAVSRVSLSVGYGQVVGLVGPNGAGKTSLLRYVSGLVGATDGRCVLDDRDLGGRSVPKRAKLGIGHVPEGRRVFHGLSVEDNLKIAALSGADRSVDAIERQLTLFPELRNLLRRTAGSLSGGEQQMLAIARALIQAPSLLLLDEPSLGLAPIIVQRVRDVIPQIASEGAGILLAEQNIELALHVADVVHVLILGELVLTIDMATRSAVDGTGIEQARREIMDEVMARTSSVERGNGSGKS